MLSKLETIRAFLWGFAPRLCGKALPFRPNLLPFPLIRAAGRLRLPPARMRSIRGSHNGKAEPFRTASGEAASHHSIAGSNLDKLGVNPPLCRAQRLFRHPAREYSAGVG